MPLFEFVCSDCGKVFEELVRFSAVHEVTCPQCQSGIVKKKVSSFASKVAGGSSYSFSSSSSSASSCSTGGT